MSELKILVADDHPLFRAALVQALQQTCDHCDIVEAENYQQALVELQSPDFDLALLDLNMPGERGVLHLADVCQSHPDVVVVVISGHDDQSTLRKVKSLGASGFITKSASMSQLSEALNQVIRDGEYWPESFDLSSSDDPVSVIAGMTPQQKRVLSMIADGKLNKQIAFSLNIQETTIKQHVSAILKKLGVYNRTQAGIIYQQAVESGAKQAIIP